MGGVSKFSTDELAEMRKADLIINQEYYRETQRLKRHRLAYQKRYDKAHKAEKKIYQHEYYLKRKAARLLEQSNGTKQNISIAL